MAQVFYQALYSATRPAGLATTSEMDAITPTEKFDSGHVSHNGTVLDIGGGSNPETYKTLINENIFWKDGKRHWQRLLPSPLLSDDTGLQLWSQINRLPHYYQTNDEVELLDHYGPEIVQHFAAGSTIVDLGAGDLRKVKNLLDSLEASKKPVQYYALDLSKLSLQNGLKEICSSYKFVKCFGLWGSFEDALKWSQTMPSPKVFLSLGSMFGNGYFEPSVAILSAWAKAMGPGDLMLVGMDGRSDKDEIWNSYHDTEGLFEKFIRNGLEHANRVMGHTWYNEEDWKVVGVLQDNPTMHRFVISAQRDVVCEPLQIKFSAGDEIDCYEAFKYGPTMMRKQFEAAELKELAFWKAPSSPIYEYLLSTTLSKGPLLPAYCSTSVSTGETQV